MIEHTYQSTFFRCDRFFGFSVDQRFAQAGAGCFRSRQRLADFSDSVWDTFRSSELTMLGYAQIGLDGGWMKVEGAGWRLSKYFNQEIKRDQICFRCLRNNDAWLSTTWKRHSEEDNEDKQIRLKASKPILFTGS